MKIFLVVFIMFLKFYPLAQDTSFVVAAEFNVGFDSFISDDNKDYLNKTFGKSKRNNFSNSVNFIFGTKRMQFGIGYKNSLSSFDYNKIFITYYKKDYSLIIQYMIFNLKANLVTLGLNATLTNKSYDVLFKQTGNLSYFNSLDSGITNNSIVLKNKFVASSFVMISREILFSNLIKEIGLKFDYSFFNPKYSIESNSDFSIFKTSFGLTFNVFISLDYFFGDHR